MRTDSPADTYRPQLRPDIIFGPPSVGKGKTIYYLKDQHTQWFYQIGEKEHFLLSRMQGDHTIAELSTAYEGTFQRRLDAKAWQSLFQMVEARQLLATSTSEVALEQLKQVAIDRKRQERRGLLRRRFSFANPDRWLNALHPWLRWAFHPLFVRLALVAILALECFIVLNLNGLIADVASLHQENIFTSLPAELLFVLCMWFSIAVHETAHGLTCKHFGGSVQEMGITWRYLMFFPYCQIDDIVLFHNRWHRVYAAFAGTFTGFLLLFPAALLWWMTPEKSNGHVLGALLLVFLNVSNFANFIPFVELDGYFMLNHALGFLDLRRQAHSFCLQPLRALLAGQKWMVSTYDQKYAPFYLVYGFASLLFTAVFITYTIVRWLTVAQHWISGPLIWIVFPPLAVLLVYRGRTTLGLSRRSAKRSRAL